MKNYPVGLLTNDTNGQAKLDGAPSGLALATPHEVGKQQAHADTCFKYDLTVNTELLPISTAVEYLAESFGNPEADGHVILEDKKFSLQDREAWSKQVKDIEK